MKKSKKDAIVRSFEIIDRPPFKPGVKTVQMLRMLYEMPTGLARYFAIDVNLFKRTGYPLQSYIDLFRKMADSLEADRAQNINREPEDE